MAEEQTRWPRHTLGLVATMLLITALPAAAIAQEPPIGPADEEPTAEELDYYRSVFTCPEIGDLEIIDTLVLGFGGNIAVTCTYRQGLSSAPTVRVTWDKPGSPSPLNCEGAGSDDFDPGGATKYAQLVAESAAVAAEYQYARDEFESLEAQFVAAAENVMAQALPFAALCTPRGIECSPEVGGMPVTFETTAGVDVRDGAFVYNCWWSPQDAGFSDLVIDVFLATEGADTPQTITICSIESSFRSGIGLEDGPANTAIYAKYSFRSPGEKFDPAAAQAEARRLIEVLAPSARSCDGVEVIPSSSYFTPLPPWLAEALTPGSASGGAPIELAMDGSGEARVLTPAPPDDTSGEQPTTATAAGAADPSVEDSGNTVLQIVGISALVLSLAG
ncbi:MAG: hypothetical protein OES13_01795, partial [Acidimicrobiia bacterium]|nr:hypothetical protein [Acidimicrobiia bacterium]